MANNNFDDFLLDPSHDDLDSLHQDSERQLYKNGGTRAERRIKRNLEKGNLDKAARISKRSGNRAAKKAYKKQEKARKNKGVVTRKVRKGPLTKAINDTSELSKKQKVGIKVSNTPNLKKTTKAQAAPSGATNAPGKTKTKRGTGVTYAGAWRDNKNNVKSKYKTYKEFETAAKAYNKKKDAAKAKSKSSKPKVKVDNMSTRS